MAQNRARARNRISGAPLYLGALVGAVVYVALRYWLVRLPVSNPTLAALAHALQDWAAVPAALVGLGTAAGVWATLRRRGVQGTQAQIEAIRALSWFDFEKLIAEAFRRQGFVVRDHVGSAAGRAADFMLFKGTDGYAVQCRQWKAEEVGVAAVRELGGIVAAEGVAGGILVTAGAFTPDAQDFARSANIRLIDGAALAEMMGPVPAAEPAAHELPHYLAGRQRPRSFAHLMTSLVLGAAIAGAMIWVLLGPGLQRLQNKLLHRAPGQPAGVSAPAHRAVTPQERRIQALREEFDRQYRPPKECEDLSSEQRVIDCGNDYIRARREFLARHLGISLKKAAALDAPAIQK